MADKHIIRLIEWLKKKGYKDEDIVEALIYIAGNADKVKP